MNWDAIGAIAESIGALGVIASLLYLAGQVRASARASAVAAKLESTGMRYWLRGQGGRTWWAKIGRMSMSPIFREFVDAEIRDIVAASQPTP